MPDASTYPLLKLFRRTPRLWICLLLAGITVAVYWPVHRFGFVSYDDYQYVYANPHVMAGLSCANLKWAFTTFATNNYIPLTWLSFLADSTVFHARAPALHVENVALHIINSILLFLLLLRATGRFWPSAVVAAIFAVHPTHVESVAWITERKDVLYMLCFLLAMHCYVRFAARSGAGWIAYFGAVFFFMCGLLSKSMLVTFPFVLLLFDVWPLGRIGAPQSEEPDGPKFVRVTLVRAIFEKVPFLLLALVATRLGYHAQASITASLRDIPLSLRAQNAVVSYVGYLAETFWPVNLSVLNPYRWQIPAATVFWCAITLSAITASLCLPGRNRRMSMVCWLWFLGTMVPAIGLVQVGPQAMADRFLYLPSIGIFVLVVWRLRPLAARAGGVVTAVAVAGIIGALMVLARRQVGYWVDSDHLFAHASTILNGPAGEEIRQGVIAAHQGRTSAARTHFEAALRVEPTNYAANFNLGNLLLPSHPADAIRCYQAAALVRPTAIEPQINWGVALMKLNDPADAWTHFRNAESLDPNSYDAHYNLGRLLVLARHFPEAHAEFELAVKARPGDPAALSQLRELQRR